MSLEGRGMDKTMNSHNKWGKNGKFLKTALKVTLNAQNTCFSRLEWVAKKSLIRVTKISCDKLWKFCLSVFRDWKFNSWVSCKGSHESFWVNLMTGASIRELVANLSREVAKIELPSFWKFSKQKHFPKTIKTLKKICV